MATSGTRAFAPSLGQIVLYAYNLVGIRSTQLLQEHMESARMAANLVLADWANKGVNLWEVELVTVPFVQGQAAYAVDPSVVNILDLYVTTVNGTQNIDRYILPVSRTEYATYQNKAQQGGVTVYWHDRLASPTVTFWEVPDGISQQSFSYYAMQTMQDANFTSGQQPDVIYLALRAFAYDLASELATIWAPDKLAVIEPKAQKYYDSFVAENVEISNVFISPVVSGYWRA
jgi:hypothetical protein